MSETLLEINQEKFDQLSFADLQVILTLSQFRMNHSLVPEDADKYACIIQVVMVKIETKFNDIFIL